MSFANRQTRCNQRQLGGIAILVVAAFTAMWGCTDLGDSSALPGNMDGSDDVIDGTMSGDDGATSDSSAEGSADGGSEGGSSEADGNIEAQVGSEQPEQVAESSLVDQSSQVVDQGSPDVATQVDSTIAESGATETGTPLGDGAADAGSDAGVDGSIDSAAVVPDSSGADVLGAGDATEAGAGGLLPCTAVGQTDCVTCPNRTDGVCTATEALFVQIDIDAKAVTAAGPDYAGPPDKLTGDCYSCLIASSCVDYPLHNIKDRECDDFTAAFTAGNGSASTQDAACLGALTCMVGPTGMQCAANPAGDSYCYCGAGGFAGMGPSSCTGTNDTAVNGPCLVPEANGFAYPQNDALDIGNNYTDNTGANPAGIANLILTCAQGNTCTACFQ
jgi:hypothetical protein